MWINGNFYFENGKVGKTKIQSEPKYLINYILEDEIQNTKNDTLEIIIQASDFYKGGNYAGIKRKITFGTSKQVYQNESNERSFNLFLIGILIVMFLYHLFLFGFRRNEFS